MHRDRITLAFFSLTLALGAAVSCTDSEPIGPSVAPIQTAGAAGNNGTGVAGSTGLAGSTTGTAGTTGAAGSVTGAAGSTTGSAGSGAAGSSNDGGADSGTATGAAGSSADGGAGAGGAPISFATSVYPILMAKCMPCHTKTAGPDGMLGMSSATVAYTGLLGNAMTGGAAMTNTTCQLLDTKKLRVEPNDPTHSYIYIKVTNTDSQLSAKACGPAMPETASGLTLTTAQKTTIHDWIMGGAKP
jgi:hypothetical protein